jgi:hypothetical protein
LNVPATRTVSSITNLVRQAVRDLRFPVLLELEERMPKKFQAAIRKDWPFYELKWNLVLGPGDFASTKESKVLFRSRERDHFWPEDAGIPETIKTVNDLNLDSFRLFHWSMGPRAHEYLSKPIEEESSGGAPNRKSDKRR